MAKFTTSGDNLKLDETKDDAHRGLYFVRRYSVRWASCMLPSASLNRGRMKKAVKQRTILLRRSHSSHWSDGILAYRSDDLHLRSTSSSTDAIQFEKRN